MKTYILIYEEFAHFEVIIASYLLKTKGEIITVGLDKMPVTSFEGFKIIPDITIENLNHDEVDIFIIPGGDPEKLTNHKILYNCISSIHNHNKVLGGICSGVFHLAKAGVLKNKQFTTSINIDELKNFEIGSFVNENCISDGNIITAKANGYVDFGIEIGKAMDIYENKADFIETIDFFKNFIG